MKKSLVIATCFSLVLILSLSIVSAGWFGDFVSDLWNRVIGGGVLMAPGDVCVLGSPDLNNDGIVNGTDRLIYGDYAGEMFYVLHLLGVYV